MKLQPMSQDRIESLARYSKPLKMATHVSYNEIASLVAEVYEYRRKFGSLKAKEFSLPIEGRCTNCLEEIIDGVCRCCPGSSMK